MLKNRFKSTRQSVNLTPTRHSVSEVPNFYPSNKPLSIEFVMSPQEHKMKLNNLNMVRIPDE